MKVTTNFVNPSYPGFDSNTGPCSFKLRLHSDVCQVAMIIIVRVTTRMGMKMRMRELLVVTFLAALYFLSSINRRGWWIMLMIPSMMFLVMMRLTMMNEYR